MNELTELQDRALTRIETGAFFAAPHNGKQIALFSEKIGDLANQLSIALGKLGIALVAMTPVARRASAENEERLLLSVPLIIQVQELVGFNQAASGSQVPALGCVKELMTRLHWWSHGINAVSGGGNATHTRVVADDPPFVLVSEQPILTYNVHFLAPLRVL